MYPIWDFILSEVKGQEIKGYRYATHLVNLGLQKGNMTKTIFLFKLL